MNTQHTVREIAERIGGKVVGDGERVISGARSIEEAGPRDLVFAEGEKYMKGLGDSKAGAVILPESLTPPPSMSGIRVSHPALGMARALEILYPRVRAFEEVSPQAYLGRNVAVAEGVGIGPGAYVGDDVRIGRGTEIHPGATIGRGSVLGEDCIVYSGAHVYHDVELGNRVILHSGVVLGADGFGFVQEKLADGQSSEPVRHRKMPQVGRVIVEDDVEIGANTAIDRAALEATVVGRGTKIDDLVMIGHNCRIGHHSILVAQAGISGSVTIGNYVTIAGQAGIAGHLKIGDRVIVGAMAGLTKDAEPGQILLGAPAIDARSARKAYALIESLPEYKKRIAELERRLEKLDGIRKESVQDQ